MSPTDLDQWRTLSPKDFTDKLLTLAEEHSDILPEKAYVGLMNASKVIHERMCNDEPEQEQGRSDIDMLGDAILRLKKERKEADELYKKYGGFKQVKNITQKIRNEALSTYAYNHSGLRLPVLSFKCLEYHCGISIHPSEYDEFFRCYLHHRNRIMTNLRREYDELCRYTDNRIKNFTARYEEML